jgi:hypothetical protein
VRTREISSVCRGTQHPPNSRAATSHQPLANQFEPLLHGVVVNGLKKSSLSFRHLVGAGRVATAFGLWEVESPGVGAMRLGTTATLVNYSNTWKLATLSLGPQSPLDRP